MLKKFGSRFVIAAAFLVAGSVYGQVAQTTSEVPNTGFLGEQFCFTSQFTNSGAVGYGPYYRLVLPPNVTFDSATIFGIGASTSNVGTFAAPDNELTDPFTEDTITGTEDGTYHNIALPVGSVVANGPKLETTICATISGSATIGENLPILLQPVYRYGDTATGENGSAAGTAVTRNIEPTLFKYAVSVDAPELETVPGSSFPMEYEYFVDVANTATITNGALAESLDSNLQYSSGAGVTGGTGCGVTAPSDSTPGGSFSGTCTGITGTSSDEDTTFSLQAYVTDILDESTCSVASVTTNSTFDAEFGGNALTQQTGSLSVSAKHIALLQSLSSESGTPGSTITVTNQIFVSEFATPNSLVVTDTLDDGFTFASHTSLTVGGATPAITPTVTANPDGTYTVSYDIHGVTGNITPGETITLVYTITIDEDYNTAPDPILAADELAIASIASYSLTGGASNCTDDSAATVTIENITMSKVILNPKAEYVPGETVTFRLAMSVPSGDTENIVFEDFLPLPVFNASSVDTTFGNDITLAVNDTAGLTPTSISINAATNSVQINWPDLDIDGSGGEVIAVDLDVEVSSVPFSDNLSLTNLFQGVTNNSVAAVTTTLTTEPMLVRSPDLVVTLGISATDNGSATVNPAASVLPVNGDATDVDAADLITFVLTLENIGGSIAQDVVATVASITGMSNANLVSVVDGNGTTITTTGDLENGLSLDTGLAVNDGSEGAPFATDTAIITFTRTLDATVNPNQLLETEASAVWSSSIGGTQFPAKTDTAEATIGNATISTTIDSVTPGAGGANIVVGDTVTYLNTITLPEGVTPDLAVSITLPAGMDYVSSSESVSTTGFVGTVDTSPTVAVAGTVNAGRTLTFSFDSPANTTITGDNSAANNSFSFSFDAIVEDDTANAATSAVQNKSLASTLTYTNISGTSPSSSADVNFAEHDLAITASVSPASNLEAGDTATVTIAVTNNGTAPAYDLTITDTVNSNSNNLFDLTTITEGTTPAGYTFNYANPTVTISADNATALAAGATVTFTYTGTVSDSVVTGSSYDIDATVAGDSQDGALGTERSDDVTGTAMAATSALSAGGMDLIDSSETFTADTGSIEAAIGEILTYEFTAIVPQGDTNETGSDALIEITLPSGMQFLTGSGLIRGVFDVGLSGSEVGALNTNNTSITPTVSGQVIEFDLGNISNTDSDASDEEIIVTFDALVLNTSDNNRTDMKTVVGAVHYNNADGNPQSASANDAADIVEPNISVTHSASPSSVAGGATVTFTQVITNTAGTNVSRAWDWALTETLPSEFNSPSLTSATLSRGSADIAACAGFVGNALTVDNSCVAASEAYLGAGDSITVVYTALVDSSIGFEETVSTTATVTVSSLPGSNGTASATPGAADSDTGERTGSGSNNGSGQAVNDLVATDSASVTSDSPTVNLSLGGAEFPVGTAGINVNAGLSVPTGSTDNFVITINLPNGLVYDGNGVTFTGLGNITNSLTPSSTPVTGQSAYAFDFGTVTNANASGVPVSVSFNTQIENVLSNQASTDLEVRAEVNFSGASAAVTDTGTITVVEPNLEISQAITAGATGSDSGDIISYQTTVQNTSSNATAYSVSMSNVVPSGFANANASLMFGSLVIDNDSGAVVLASDNTTGLTSGDFSKSTTSFTNDTLSAASFNLPPSSTLTVSYNLVLNDNVSAGDMLVNSVTTSYNSLADNSGRSGATANSDDDDNTDLNNYNESGSSTLTVDSAIAIQSSLNAVHADNDFAIGESVTFDLRVDVIEGMSSSVELVNVLPSGLTYQSSNIVADSNISYSGTGTGTESPTGTVTFDFGNVTNTGDASTTNDFFTVTVTATVDDSVTNSAGDVLTNSASVSNSATSAGPSTTDIDIIEPNLVLNFTPDRATATLGDVISLTVEVAHSASTATAYETVFDLNIPDGLSYVANSFTGQGSLDDSDPTSLGLDMGVITTADTNKSFVIQLQVDNDANVNSALTVSAANGTYTSMSGTVAGERTYTLAGSTNLMGDTTASIDATQTMTLVNDVNANGIIEAGDTIEISAVLTNNGNTVSNAIFTELVPANTTYVAASLTATSGTPDDSSAPELSVDLGTMNNSDTVTVTFRVTVDAGTPAGTTLFAQGTVDSDATVPEPTDADGIDANGDQPNSLIVGAISGALSELYVLQSAWLSNDADSDNHISPGDTLTIAYSVKNTGSTDLTNVSVAETLPAGLTYVNASVSITNAHSASVNAGALTSSIASLASQATEVITLQVTVDSPLIDNNGSANSETFEFQADINSDETNASKSDGNGVREDGNQLLTLIARDDASGSATLAGELRWLLINDVNGDGDVDNGDTVRLRSTIQNQGSAIANNVRYNLPLPSDTTLVTNSSFTSQGAVATESPLNVNLGNLSPGAFAYMSVDVVIDNTVADGDVLSAQGLVSADGIASVNTDDNGLASDGINPTLIPINLGSAVAPSPVLSFSNATDATRGSANSFYQGDSVSLSLTVSYQEALQRGNVLSITIPTGLSYTANSAKLARVFDQSIISASDVAAINSAATGVTVDVSSLVSQAGQVITLDIGDVINSDNDANDESFVFTVGVTTSAVTPVTADDDYVAQGSVAYRDGLLQSQSQNATDLTIILLNQVPVANDDAYTVSQGSVNNTFSVLSNDVDSDTGHTVTITSVSVPSDGGTAVIDGNNIIFSPLPPYNGTETFTYRISDGIDTSTSATVTVTVLNDNNPPVAVNDTATVDEDSTGTVLAILDNDTDADNDSLGISVATALNGTVTINNDGTISYTPNADFIGTDTISYTISDGKGGTASATVSVTVNNANNDQPEAAEDTATVDEDSSNNSISVLANDTDLDNDTLTVTAASAENGTVTVNPDNTLSYTPNPNFFGVDTITYTISDGNGGTSTTTVTVTVPNTNNDAPEANNDSATVTGNSSGNTLNVLDNDTDIDEDTLTVTSAVASNGSVSVNPDGTLNYTPATDFVGTDTITYTISDGNGGTATATVTVTVTEVPNAPPVAFSDSATISEDTANYVIDVLSNDTDADGDNLTVTAATPSSGTVSINSDGTMSYTPEPDFIGVATIDYTISDGNGGTATSTVLITVNNANNDLPIAVNDTATVPEDSSVVIEPLLNDSDPDGDTLTVTNAVSEQGEVTVNSDGTLTFTPNDDFNGPATITYQVNDGNGGVASATIAVNVTPQPDLPTANNDVASVGASGSAVIDVLGNDTDVDGDTLTVESASSADGDVTINDDGTLTFVPAPGFTGTTTISYTVSDGNGGTATATVTVTVNTGNQLPEATPDVANVGEDSIANVIDVLANDSDPDGDELSVTEASAENGTVTISDTGEVLYTPAENFIGTDTITYVVSDGNGGLVTSTVTVTVDSVNDAPVATDDVASVGADGSTTISVLDNDIDADGDEITVTGAESNEGTVTINDDGTILFVANDDFVGVATVVYTIDDGNGGTDIGTITINVNSDNNLPVADADTATIEEDSTDNIIDVLANDSDADNDPLTITSAAAANGTVTITAEGTLAYTPNPDFTGIDTITYEISDGNGGTATATVTVTVNGVNDDPIAQADNVTVLADSTDVVLNILSNDTDADGDTLSLVSAVADNGTIVINDDGTVSYTPAAGFVGEDTITYTISDGNGGFSTATITVNVANEIEPLVASADTAVVTEGTSNNVIPVTTNDVSATGVAITVTSANANNGTVTVNGDGTVSYTPDPNFIGTDTITYEIIDSLGNTATTTVSVTVLGANGLPLANDDSATVQEDSSNNIIDVLVNDLESGDAGGGSGDTLVVTAASAQFGEVTINSDGTLSYTPSEDFNGLDVITYTIRDSNGGTSTATVNVTVEGVNDLPSTVDDIIATGVGESVVIEPLLNDTDPEGDDLSIIDVNVTEGTVIIQPDGTLLYIPDEGFEGTATIEYIVSDGNGGTTTGTITVLTTDSNLPPQPTPDSVTSDVNTSVTVAPMTNDSDPNGDDISLVSASANVGQVIVNADGTFIYTPPIDFTGQAIVTYVIEDEFGASATSTVTILIDDENSAPVINGMNVTVQEDTPITINVLDIASDPDVEPVSIVSVTAQTGNIVINNDGTFEFIAPAGFLGTVDIEVCVADPQQVISCATVSVEVNSENLPPEVFNFNFEIAEDTSLALDLTGLDPENQPLTYTQLSSPDGTIEGDYPLVTFVPNANFNGTTTFTYQANDGELDSNVGTVTITVVADDDGPIAIDDVVGLPFPEQVNIPVLDNDSHPDGDTIIVVGATTDVGTVTFTDGFITYTPVAGFFGEVVIDYTIADSDGDTASAQIVINIQADESGFFPVINVPDDIFIDANALFTKVDLGVASAIDRFGNPLPVSTIDGTTLYEPGNNKAFWAATDSEGRTTIASQSVRVRPLVSMEKDQVVLEGHTVRVGIYLNGVSPVYPLEVPYTVTGSADQSDHNLVSGVIVFESGSEQYIEFEVYSDFQFEGIETINIELSDILNRGAKFNHVVTIREDNVNPDVELFPSQAGEQRVVIDVNGGLVTVTSVITHPDPNNEYEYLWQSIDADFADLDTDPASFTFNPEGNALGIYRLRLDVFDADDSGFTDNATLYMDFNDSLPTLDAGMDSDLDGIPDIVEGVKDSDGDGIADYKDPISECNVLPQEVDFVDGYLLEGDPGVCLRLGSFAIESIEGGAKIIDDDVNALPNIVPDEEAVNIGGVFDFIAYGLPEEGSTHRIVTPLLRPVPKDAVYRKFLPETGWGNFVLTERDRLWSSPGEPGYCFPPSSDVWVEGLVEGYWCVQVEIVDGGPNDADGLVNGTVVDPGGVSVLLVNNDNQLPVAVDDEETTEINMPVMINALVNDTDPDGDLLEITSADTNFGQVELVDNQVLFTPSQDYIGSALIKYGITDNNGGTDLANIIVTVAPPNQPPVAVDDAQSGIAGEPVTISVLNNDSDPDGEQINVISVTSQDGDVQINTDGTITFVSATSFSGVATITYRIEDESGGIAEATVTITIAQPAVATRIENKGEGGGSLYWLLFALLPFVMFRRYQQHRSEIV